MLYNLMETRKRAGLSRKEAAELFGVQLGTYRNWEQCVNAPRDNAKVKQIADAPGQLDSFRQQITALNAQLAPLVASIGESTLKELAQDILEIDPPIPDSPRYRKYLEKNTEVADVLNVIRDRLDAIAKDILEEVAQKRVDMV